MLRIRGGVVTWVSVAVVVLAVVGGVYYYLAYLAYPSNIRTSKSVGGFPVLPSVNPTEPIGPIEVAAITATSITVRANDAGDTFVYSIGTTTHVYSLALEGKQGKTFADIQKGLRVTIYPVSGDSGVALAIAFPRDPSLVPTKEETQSSVSGVVSAITAGSVTIAPQSGAPVTIVLNSSTKIYTTVIEGQAGRPLAVGEHVGATGVATVGGKTTATMILIAPNLAK